jgi:hypothetical protein
MSVREDHGTTSISGSVGEVAGTAKTGGTGACALARLAETIRASLATDGLALVATRLSAEDFEALGSLIGVVEERTDIRIDPARRQAQMASRSDALGKARPGVYQAESLGMHTDRPTAAVLAWYCFEQDVDAGETILVDTSDMADYFSLDELTTLAGVQVSYAVRRPNAAGEMVFRQPLLTRSGARYEVFYVPWNVAEPSTTEARCALEKFADYVRQGRDQRAIRIRLWPGESMFIDNRRMLHGRDALPEASKRHLLRLYIRTPPAP